MPEPYAYFFDAIPQKAPIKGRSASWVCFFRQLALMLVLGWALSALAGYLTGRFEHELYRSDSFLGPFLLDLLLQLTLWLAGMALPLLLYSCAAPKPLPVRMLRLCLLFCCTSCLAALLVIMALPWSSDAALTFLAGAAGWVCGALAAGADTFVQNPQKARRLARGLAGLFGGMLLLLLLLVLLVDSVSSTLRALDTRTDLLVELTMGAAGPLALAGCFVLVRRSLGLPRGGLLPSKKTLLLFLLGCLGFGLFCCWWSLWQMGLTLKELLDGDLYLAWVLLRPGVDGGTVLRVAWGTGLLWYTAWRAPLSPLDLPRGARGARLTPLYQRAAAGDPDAQFELAACYAQGAGTLRAPKKAAYWYCAAAQNGSTAALLALLELERASKTADKPPNTSPNYSGPAGKVARRQSSKKP